VGGKRGDREELEGERHGRIGSNGTLSLVVERSEITKGGGGGRGGGVTSL